MAGKKVGPGKEQIPEKRSQKEIEEEAQVMKSVDMVTYRLTDERRKRLEQAGFVFSMKEDDNIRDYYLRSKWNQIKTQT